MTTYDDIKSLESELNSMLNEYENKIKYLNDLESKQVSQWYNTLYRDGNGGFMINKYGYKQEFDDYDKLDKTCKLLKEKQLTDNNKTEIDNLMNNNMIFKGVNRISEPCGLENKNIRNSNNEQIGFVSPDGTLQIYPDDDHYCNDIKPTTAIDFNLFHFSEDIKKCKLDKSNIKNELKELEIKIKKKSKVLKDSMMPFLKDISKKPKVYQKIQRLSKIQNEIEKLKNDVDTSNAMYDINDIMKQYNGLRLMFWFTIVLIGISIVVSIIYTGNVSTSVSMLVVIIVCMFVYFNWNYIKTKVPIKWLYPKNVI